MSATFTPGEPVTWLRPVRGGWWPYQSVKAQVEEDRGGPRVVIQAEKRDGTRVRKTVKRELVRRVAF